MKKIKVSKFLFEFIQLHMIFKLWMEDVLYTNVLKILYYYILVITNLSQTI